MGSTGLPHEPRARWVSSEVVNQSSLRGGNYNRGKCGLEGLADDLNCLAAPPRVGAAAGSVATLRTKELRYFERRPSPKGWSAIPEP